MIDGVYRSDGDDRFAKMVTRLRPSQLNPGEVALSENGRMDVDGAWKPREGYENVASITLTNANPINLVGAGEDRAIMLIGVSGGTDTAAVSSNVVTVTTAAAHGLPSGHTSLINLSGFTAAGSGADINGNQEVTRTSDTEFTFPLTSANDTYSSGTIGPVKLTGDVVAIRGACLFSDPDDGNIDYVIIADNLQATAVKIGDLSKTAIAFPAGETLNQKCDLVQEFGVVVLRQAGKTSWYFDPDDGSAGFGGTPAFVKFGTGAATQHKIFTSATNTTISAGVVTVAEASHGLSVGDRISIVDSSSLLGLTNGTSYKVASVPTSGSFTFYADADDASATSVVYSTVASLGGGFINPPAAPWGVYHQRRSWVPYNYDSASTPAHRGIEDEIIASDILSHVYDPIGSQFRVSGGSADFTVALHGFNEDRLLVLNRNSIHYLRGVSGSLADVETIELTKDIGCIARKSVVSYADQVFFLSDNGVYAVSFLDEYNLRGTDLPLSEAVEPIVKRITPSAADGAIGVYHNNRYWLAVPIDGAEFNNALLVYNFLNGGWESLDTTGAEGTGWCIEELVTARSGKVNELYAVTTFGGLHKLDNTGRAEDLIITRIGSTTAEVISIPAAVTPRQYTFGDLRRKKFNRLRMHFESDEGHVSQGSVSLIVEDPDQTIELGELREQFSGGLPAGEDGTFDIRTGNPRGFAAQVKFTVESGRPSLRAVQMDAVGAFESTTSVT